MVGDGGSRTPVLNGFQIALYMLSSPERLQSLGANIQHFTATIQKHCITTTNRLRLCDVARDYDGVKQTPQEDLQLRCTAAIKLQ